ncbi:MAG TPA: Ig-like domain-containing protein [Polyangia bacterium]
MSLALPLLVAACGQSLQPLKPFDSGLPADDLSMERGDGGSKDLGTALIDMTGFNQPGSPAITITAPTATTEVAGDTLSVTATITSPTSTQIKSDSVLITITPPGGAIITAPMSLTATANVYSGQINIGSIPSGPSSFTVSATDSMGLAGSAVGMYIHDHGPTITFVQPSAATAHNSVTLEAIIDDTLHPITMLSQVQAGIRMLGDITLTQVTGAVPFRVTATIDLNSYNPTLDGPQLITVQATNSNNTKTSATKQFTVDNSGPDITINTPAAGSFVGGVVTISATITDLSDVNDSTVVAVFGGNLATSVALTRTDPTKNDYTGVFDVRSLGRNYVFPEFSVRADDTLGNHGELGEEIVVDNTPPWMTMNEAITMRVGQTNNTGQFECSQPFPPLGDEAVQEGAKVLQIITLRARVEDHGNTAPGLLVERISKVDPTTVTLFAVPDSAGVVLAVDTDNDANHECDDVNPLLIPTSDVMMSGEALALQLSPLARGAGAPNFAPGGTTPAGCDLVGETGFAPPKPICTTSDMTYVVPTFTDPTGAIFSIAPVSTNECVGFQLDSLNRLPEGPTCVITRAQDMAGNQMVSYPLHICIDRGTPGVCSTFAPASTDCTGRWDKVTQKLVAGFCNPPTPKTTGFPTDGSEIRDLDLIH